MSKIMKIRQCFLELQLKMSGMFFWDTLHNADLPRMRVFPVTWQRWRSHNSIRHIQKPRAVRKLNGSVFYRTTVIADRSFTSRYSRNYKILRFLLLSPRSWHDDSYANLTRIRWKYPRRPKREFSTSRLLKVIVSHTNCRLDNDARTQ